MMGLLALSQLLLYGCSDRLLTVNVDLLSFMDSTAVTQTYGENPIIPPNAVAVVQSPPQQINLTEGLADITDVQSVTLHLDLEFANETGSADVLLEIFVADTETDPYSTTPYVQEEIHLLPATADTIYVNTLGDDRLGELLTGKAAQVGIKMTLNSHDSPGNVMGTETLTRFTATVVAKRHIP